MPSAGGDLLERCCSARAHEYSEYIQSRSSFLEREIEKCREVHTFRTPTAANTARFGVGARELGLDI